MIRHFYLWKLTDEYRTWKAERPLQYVEQAIPDYHADVCDVRSGLSWDGRVYWAGDGFLVGCPRWPLAAPDCRRACAMND